MTSIAIKKTSFEVFHCAYAWLGMRLGNQTFEGELDFNPADQLNLIRSTTTYHKHIVWNIIMCIIVCMGFEWDDSKNTLNINKHGLSFYEAQDAFFDTDRVILEDTKHSPTEKRYFCVGKTARGGIATVRFTIRNDSIRIIGAGYWRKGKKIYEQQH